MKEMNFMISSGVLSQEEIDALLKVDESSAPDTASAAPANSTVAEEVHLSDVEIDAVGEIANISMGSAATALSQLLGRKVDITTPRVSLTSLKEIKESYQQPYVLVNVEYTLGIEGANVLIVKDTDAQIIVDLMMGGDGTAPPTELSEIHISAVSEAMNQMMGSAATSMSTILKQRIDISPPILNMTDLDSVDYEKHLGNPLIKVAFRMQIEDLIDSEIMQLMPVHFARDLVKDLMHQLEEESVPQVKEEIAATVAQPNTMPPQSAPIEQVPPMAAAPNNMPMSGMENMGGYPPNYPPNYPPMGQPYGMPNYGMGYPPQGGYPQGYQMPPSQTGPSVTVQPAQFAPLNAGNSPREMSNIDLIADVPLQITVELGRTRKTIRDILALSAGAIIELDKLAGEPVDVLVNGKILAKGEVVVIDENFGIRITDIISPVERVSNLQ
jgi:flagellar motor switch protein FliN